MDHELYFIALIPPESIKERIQDLKLEVAEKFNSSHSLNAPPHITLISPFRVSHDQLSRLHSILEVYTQGHQPFQVDLKNFSTFPPRVIFIDVELSETLKQFQQKLENMIRSEEAFGYNYQERAFHPHITLAFKDLSKEDFYRAWDDFKNQRMQEQFIAKQVSLLKHNGEVWQVSSTFQIQE